MQHTFSSPSYESEGELEDSGIRPQSFDDWMEEMLEKERLKQPSLDSLWMCKMSSSLDLDGPAVVEPRMNEGRLRREQDEAEDDDLDNRFIVRPRPGSSREATQEDPGEAQYMHLQSSPLPGRMQAQMQHTRSSPGESTA